MTKLLGNYDFTFVQELVPEIRNGSFYQYAPQSLYVNERKLSLNKHGEGYFCRFGITKEWNRKSGVYALYNNAELLYIGECVDLRKRYNHGYGNISPKNCFIGGQPTNCKINSLILKEYLSGRKVFLYFYATAEYKKIEKELIFRFCPRFNGKL